ncbi:WD40 repeat domain-containing protein [Streptomyces sp. NBC_01500]|uniref:WD40 repeat domain-containing protein n=1 Tax=Streptomyces sp. NBC_01500 TaxID=2903886 RepID=UPI0022564E02|nr:hypothetical protein [Streptomyces sp. NBC_01500]MCX4552529.1 hypothetical protein [Streptomyces sp. NBC_01500]
MWDLADGSPVTVLRAHSDVVLSLTAVDGPTPLLVSAGKDRVLRVWSPDYWSHTVLRGHLAPVAALAAGRLPDGRRFLLSAGADCLLRRWDLPPSGGPATPAGVMYGHTGPVHALAVARMSGTGRCLAVSGGDDGTVRIWDPERLSTYRVVPGRIRSIRALAPFTPGDRTLVAVAGQGSRIAVVDPAAGTVVRLLNSRVSAPTDPEGTRAGTGNQVVLSLREPASPGRSEPQPGAGAYALAPLTSGNGTPLFASAGWDGAVRLWDANSGGSPDQPDYDRHRARLISALPHPPEELPWALAVVGVEGGAWLTDAQGRRHAPLWPGHRTVRHLATLLLPDGRSVVALVEEDSSVVRLLDAATQEEVTVLAPADEDRGTTGPVTSLTAFTEPGRIAVLYVRYEKSAPLAFAWHRPTGHVRIEGAFAPGQYLAEVPFGNGQGQWLVAAVDFQGNVEVHGAAEDGTEVWSVGATWAPVVTRMRPVALRMPSGEWALAVATHGPSPEPGAPPVFPYVPQHVLELWDLSETPAEMKRLTLRHTGDAVLRWARLERHDQDLLVAVCADNHLRVWNPDRPDRDPVTVPLPGPATGLTTVGPDTVYVLVDEHWLAFRLLGLGPLLTR